jgi:hypothetical protein
MFGNPSHGQIKFRDFKIEYTYSVEYGELYFERAAQESRRKMDNPSQHFTLMKHLLRKSKFTN